MGLILSLDNSIHSFNTGKFVLDQYTGAAAGYSLRRLSVNTTNVVRVRRSSDNAEDDFTADEVADGTMLNWVNADMPLPLDTATAAAAYSLRNLKTSYTGSVIRVRRSSDNAEADFTATEITDGTLLAWVGNTASDNGFVTTWYDQVGSSDATQGTAASQPKIVDAGVLVEENGRPAVSFDGVDDYLQPSFKVLLKIIAMQFVYNYKTLANSGMALFLSELPQSYNGFNSSTETRNSFLGGGIAQQRPISKSTNQRSWSLYANSSSAAFYLNGLKQGADMPSNTDSLSSENLTIGSVFNGSIPANIKAQELIVYQTDQSSNRTGIETNINDYYNIYAQDRDGFVTTWYDQSGNGNDATQGTAANQPKIVDAGVLVEENGNPAVDFDGIADAMQTGSLAIAQPYTIFNVVKSDITGAVNHVYSTSTTATSLIFINTDVIRIDAGVYLSSAINQRDTNQTVLSNFYNGATSSIYKDGTSIASGNAGTNTLNNLRIGAPSFASQLFDGKQQELIIYPSDQSSNRTGIETNINNHYNIYP